MLIYSIRVKNIQKSAKKVLLFYSDYAMIILQNNKNQKSKRKTVMEDKPVDSSENQSWNRERTAEELQAFISSRFAALETAE